jgi:hypothetical protein
VLALLVVGGIAAAVDGDDAEARTRARLDVLSIVEAVKKFNFEYGRLPSVIVRVDAHSIPDKDATVGDPAHGASFHNSALFNVLRALDATTNAGHGNNPRRQVFLGGRSILDPVNPRGGFVDAQLARPVLRGCFVDPWGHEYLIRIDYDASGTIDAPGGKVVSQSVLAWSMGPDGKPGTEDDIVSWQ